MLGPCACVRALACTSMSVRCALCVQMRVRVACMRVRMCVSAQARMCIDCACGVTPGYVWLRVVTFGYVWLRAVAFGCVWLRFGFVWLHLAVFGYTCVHVLYVLAHDCMSSSRIYCVSGVALLENE